MRSNVSVNCTEPCGSGKEQWQQIAPRRVENLWVSLRQLVAAGDQEGEDHTPWDRDIEELPY